MTAFKEQSTTLKKKFEEAEKAKNQAEQDRYDVRVAKTDKAFKVEVLEVCRSYCLQMWNKALNQARVEASSALRRAESVYYPLAICLSSSASSKVDIASEVAEIGKDSPSKVSLSLSLSLSPDNPFKKAK